MTKRTLGNWLLVLGAVVTLAGSLTIEVVLILGIVAVKITEMIRPGLVGVGLAIVGIAMLVVGKRVKS